MRSGQTSRLGKHGVRGGEFTEIHRAHCLFFRNGVRTLVLSHQRHWPHSRQTKVGDRWRRRGWRSLFACWVWRGAAAKKLLVRSGLSSSARNLKPPCMLVAWDAVRRSSWLQLPLKMLHAAWLVVRCCYGVAAENRTWNRHLLTYCSKPVPRAGFLDVSQACAL